MITNTFRVVGVERTVLLITTSSIIKFYGRTIDSSRTFGDVKNPCCNATFFLNMKVSFLLFNALVSWKVVAVVPLTFLKSTWHFMRLLNFPW